LLLVQHVWRAQPSARAKGDDDATTQELTARHGLRFPVVTAPTLPRSPTPLGALVHHDPLFLKSAGFVLDQNRHPELADRDV